MIIIQWENRIKKEAHITSHCTKTEAMFGLSSSWWHTVCGSQVENWLPISHVILYLYQFKTCPVVNQICRFWLKHPRLSSFKAGDSYVFTKHEMDTAYQYSMFSLEPRLAWQLFHCFRTYLNCFWACLHTYPVSSDKWNWLHTWDILIQVM